MSCQDQITKNMCSFYTCFFDMYRKSKNLYISPKSSLTSGQSSRKYMSLFAFCFILDGFSLYESDFGVVPS